MDIGLSGNGALITGGDSGVGEAMTMPWAAPATVPACRVNDFLSNIRQMTYRD